MRKLVNSFGGYLLLELQIFPSKNTLQNLHLIHDIFVKIVLGSDQDNSAECNLKISVKYKWAKPPWRNSNRFCQNDRIKRFWLSFIMVVHIHRYFWAILENVVISPTGNDLSHMFPRNSLSVIITVILIENWKKPISIAWNIFIQCYFCYIFPYFCIQLKWYFFHWN